MNWEKKRILLVVKAYPESSKKHGSVVCTAGITEEGEWIRIYPVPFEAFRGDTKIPKYTWIEAEVKQATDEKLGRKESYKLRQDSIQIIDDSLTKKPVNWDERNKIVFSMPKCTIEALQMDFKEDRTSLGLVKPSVVHNFFTTENLEEIDNDIIQGRQMTLLGEKRTLLEELPHIFKYHFSCTKNCLCNHNMTCEDWELFQSYRSWRYIYPTTEVLWEKIYQKFYTTMIEERDLHFFVGTHSLYPVWMIIGLYYPPK